MTQSLKKILVYICTALLPSIPAFAASNHALTEGVAPYVYPQNIPSAPPSLSYLPDGSAYLMLEDGGHKIVAYDLATGKAMETIFDVSATREEKLDRIEGFTISPEGAKILVWVDSQPLYRRSRTARYYVYERRSRLLKTLSSNWERQQSPIFSPNGRMVAFVARDNNIYVKKLDYDTEVAVTTDGAKNAVINGVPDWTYEEEFDTTCSMAWAPDDQVLSYLKYDESAVPVYRLPLYEGTCDPKPQYALYPGEMAYKYPVAGQPNSTVSLHSYDVETRKIKDITLPDSRIEYIPRIIYGDIPERLMVLTLNRDQNHLEFYAVNPKSGLAKSVYTEDSKTWIIPEAYEKAIFDAEGFIVINTQSGFAQAYAYSYEGALIKRLTSGDFDVTDNYGRDAKGNYYYGAAKPTPMDRTVYVVNQKGAVSVYGHSEGGTTSVEFAPGKNYGVMKYSNATTPPVYTTVSGTNGKAVRTLEENSAYGSRYSNCPVKEFFCMTSDGVTLNGYMIRPAGFDPSLKYPAIMYQYSGPGSQEVRNVWRMDWDVYFATQGYAVFCVDGRGTGGRGREFMDIVYKDLGHYETIDQINAARYAASLPWVDQTRIGIFGWSYGGYEALMAATSSTVPSPYSAVVAVAPVTDWRYYDTVYAERYMLTPQQNEDGYRASAPINYANSLDVPLLIMSGTADDNVHPQNSLQYVSTLQNAGILCDMLMFTNMNHSILGCNARAVVYAKMLDFFNKNL